MGTLRRGLDDGETLEQAALREVTEETGLELGQLGPCVWIRESRFPGRRAGQPIHPGSLRLRLHRLGIPNLNGRTRAIRDLLQQAPPAVFSSMLGYHPNTAETLAAQAGTRWQRYATSRTHTQHTPADNPR